MSTSSAKNTISNGSVLIRSASSAGSVAFPCVEHSELDPMVSVVVRSPCPLPREARQRTAPSVRRQSRSGTLATVPTATPTAPGSARPPRPGPKNTRPRFHRCSAHRTRLHSAHRPRSRPVSGLSLRQLASDPFHPVEGGCANDYVYVFGDPVNDADLSGLLSRKECRKEYNDMWSAIKGPKGLLYRANFRAKYRDFGTRSADGHIKAFGDEQRRVTKHLDKWDKGGCNNRNWPGGTSAGLQVAMDLATMPDPGTGAPVPRVKGVMTSLAWHSVFGGAAEAIGSRLSPDGGGGIAYTP